MSAYVPWYRGPLAAFDLETTGTDPETDRIVTAAIVGINASENAGPDRELVRWQAVNRYGWIAGPGVEIPAAAAAVHGVTTDRARAEGRPAAKVIREIAMVLTEYIQAGTPIVVMNAPYDFTMLDRELERHGLPPLVWGRRRMHVIDPRVLDKEVDRWRKGKRTLTDLCAHYGVTLDGAHEAAADALAAARVAVAIGEQHSRVGSPTVDVLHLAQERWARQQAEGLADYFRRVGRLDDAASVRTDWPLIPRQRVAE